ncbi:MAG: hypothetical protein A2566_02335 [Candidatus Zambryskibacteria bacterium RIFOXYD1_FULL_40_13]|nr:MAG: Septum formation initiator [Parcubacteria group bacterium GW2011_GWC1_39_12]KKR19052.1 MAG: Septum formation initiator [Parcubacteria group bacterium GW2011_GWF1_39_37]KKR35619.1 MAG: Septum formation initiator [Parcubacteria group bacterium GW2011_GWC2_40_10]KKR52030.1 MAG: Septum formation initiator [Parcubacteria group bacterium GW2011_GWE1_40_20]KKR68778.1 MAG: Septum formation initiator [Parcubacteria group bacterium GW2011_GWF2_40_69]KKR80585.1 MAG: Septum formation initiator [Pa
MLDFQQKRKISKIAYSRVTLVILLVLILVMIRSTWIVYQKKRTSEEMKNISEQNVEVLRSRNDELKALINRLETQPGIEEEIRLKFNVVKGEENMVVVVEDERGVVGTTSPEVSFWQKIKTYFSR